MSAIKELQTQGAECQGPDDIKLAVTSVQYIAVTVRAYQYVFTYVHIHSAGFSLCANLIEHPVKCVLSSLPTLNWTHCKSRMCFFFPFHSFVNSTSREEQPAPPTANIKPTAVSKPSPHASRATASIRPIAVTPTSTTSGTMATTPTATVMPQTSSVSSDQGISVFPSF